MDTRRSPDPRLQTFDKEHPGEYKAHGSREQDVKQARPARRQSFLSANPHDASREC